MKKLSLIIFLSLIVIISHAQKSTAFGSFNISVVMPEESDELDAGQLAKLETKIMRIVEASGVSASGEYSNFVIYPKFDVYQSDIVEGGMQNITVTGTQLSLFIKQVDNNLVFSSITKNLKGSGNTKANSLTNAISTLDVNDPLLRKFVETGKSKIVAYYNAKCGSILASAENMAKKRDFEQALILAFAIPEGTSCYTTAQTKAIAYYKSYQNIKCLEEIKHTNLSLAENDYADAVNHLMAIEPGSACAKEAATLMKKIESKVNAEEKRDYDRRLKEYNDENALEKYRISAIRDIASAYYKSTPSVQYRVIVR